MLISPYQSKGVIFHPMYNWFWGDPPCGCSHQGWFQGLPIVGPPYGKLPILFPYPTPIRIPKDMGIVWEAYHKGVPLLGVPENSTDLIAPPKKNVSSKQSMLSGSFLRLRRLAVWGSDLPMGWIHGTPWSPKTIWKKKRFFTQRLCFL